MNSPPFSLDFLQPDDSKDDDSPPNLHAEQPFQLDQELLPADPPIIPSTSEENMPVLDTFPATNDFADDFATIKPGANDSCSIVFEFVDENTVSCGICGQSVLYSALFGYHLPRVHPEIKIGNVTVEDIASKEERPVFVSRIPILEDLRIVRKISQFRISTDMNLDLMNKFLQRKLVEKIGRRLPVTLITKERVKCGLCSTPISVNKKFEISNIIRHFSSWHFGHTCAGKWMKKTSYKNGVKALSIEDFVVINIKMSAPENLQCIWCGDAFSSSDLCEHFVEKHADQLAVPRCYLCVQEMIINARMLEKYRQYFEITIQDENQYRCAKLAKTFESELEMDIAIMKRFKEVAGAQKTKDDPASDDTEVPARKRVSNSLQDFGLHYKRKRRFVQPQLRQAAPKNSQFVTVVVHNTHWKCKLCDEDIIGAVISASAIKHYKLQHSAQLEQLQYELVKARLERISSGCMEFIHPQLVDCMVCCKQYKLHKPYNISRCVRHLQSLHAGAMPEYYEQGATNQEEDAEIYDEEAANEQAPENLDETQTIYVNEQNAVYVQLDDDEFFDLNLNAEIPENLFLEAEQKPTPNQSKTKIQDPYSLEDPFGFFDEDTMLHEMEEQALVPKVPHPSLGQNEDQVPNEIV